MPGDKLIPVAQPWMDEQEAEAARRPILAGWVTQGPEVAAFEQEFAEAVGAPHACAVANCTTALHLALLAAGVGPGDEVVTVSHSFIASSNAIRYCRAVPVFVDIQPHTFNIDPGLIEGAMTSQTRAILCVHQIGMPSALPEILAIGRRRDVFVIEDAACAVGSEILMDGRWERIGRPRGDAACFSFHPRKLLTTGDGGMITTAHAAWDRQFRLWRQHAMSVPDADRHSSRTVAFEQYEALGYNYRLTDIQGAIGRQQLKRLADIVARRREQARHYRELLADVSCVCAPDEPVWARSNWQSYCVRLHDDLDQHDVMQRMLAAGVATRRGVMCAHREPAYGPGTWRCGADTNCDGPLRGTCVHLRSSEQAQDHSIILPLFHEMTDAEQLRVVEVLRAACM